MRVLARVIVDGSTKQSGRCSSEGRLLSLLEFSGPAAKDSRSISRCGFCSAPRSRQADGKILRSHACSLLLPEKCVGLTLILLPTTFVQFVKFFVLHRSVMR